MEQIEYLPSSTTITTDNTNDNNNNNSNNNNNNTDKALISSLPAIRSEQQIFDLCIQMVDNDTEELKNKQQALQEGKYVSIVVHCNE